LAQDYAALPVVMLEQNVDSTVGMRYDRWWAAYGGGGSVYLPLVMADSGHQYSSGYVSFYTVYKGLIDAELSRPPGAEIAARASRIGDRYRVSVTLVNHSGVTLSATNGASVHVIVYEDIKVGVTSRTVRDAVYANVTSPIADGGSATFTLDTNALTPGDWSRLHVIALADYRPGGATGAYDMLQAAFAGIVAPRAGDLDGDRKSDLVWRHASGGDVWLWPMNGAARTAESYVRTVADTNWEIRGIADFTGDGKADLLWRHKTLGMIYLWPMNGSAPQAETFVATVDPAYDIVGTGDFDGDGKADILWRHTMLGEVWLWRMDRATPLNQVYLGTVDPAYVIKGVADVDGDGKADILWHHATAGEVWVWRMDGTTKLSETWVGTVADVGYQIAGLADFTGDGKADILWHHTTAGQVWLWPMDGTTRLAETWAGTVPDTNYRILGNGDYDGDGKADILWHHATLGEVWVWLMDGAARLSQAWVGSVPDTGYRIVR
jgi:hypothetical protein